MHKTIAVLGSTGSIGRSTLQVARHLGEQSLRVEALAAHSQIDLLEEQARLFHPRLLAVYDKEKAHLLQKRIPHIPVVAGMEGLLEVASLGSVELVVSALSGSVGIAPTLSAIRSRKTVALANKEVLISAGELIVKEAEKFGVSILPIDSEHSALWQCLDGKPRSEVRRLVLTASGGPFLYHSDEDLRSVRLEEALKHPNWRMGPKVTIDSSNLMNKGLEVIEARWLFGIPLDQIEVVIHPQSIVHSFVEMIDGSMLAQLSEPSMLIPIQYALTYPKRERGILPPFDFTKMRTLEFFPPDRERFRCLDLAYEALRKGGTAPCFLSAANEVCVEQFVSGKIAWIDIPDRLERLLSSHRVESPLSLEILHTADQNAREQALAMS
ncbi:MAG: 1-deoxy-D-xylulose-5-phosphate reductoisomerase [Verrucomicrobia bacterium]|nr:1-deoxy-D-xylulose-5-phosphate reductoisomerase [Verrucomicrobiota bacterium]